MMTRAPRSLRDARYLSARALLQQRTAMARDLALFFGVHRAYLASGIVRMETEKFEPAAHASSHFGAVLADTSREHQQIDPA